jgi:hypothetical protein
VKRCPSFGSSPTAENPHFPTEVAQDEGSLLWALVLARASPRAVALFPVVPVEPAWPQVAALLQVVVSAPEPAVPLEPASRVGLGVLAARDALVGQLGAPAGHALGAPGVPPEVSLPAELAAARVPAVPELLARPAALPERDRSGAWVAALGPAPAHAVPRRAVWPLQPSAAGRGLRQRTGRGWCSRQSFVAAERLTAPDAAASGRPVPGRSAEYSRRLDHRCSSHGCK